eukprot:TRINITY_DN3095_c0_g2_i1.p1 TRINITY_DN3095_c0_g2~~TRINITY_DN3095_c0_g2_i1.p1  ORF type:complete len:548 (+),score=83.91 TRINITY_DN3095_c0_g2_i1:79-1722(+)
MAFSATSYAAGVVTGVLCLMLLRQSQHHSPSGRSAAPDSVSVQLARMQQTMQSSQSALSSMQARVESSLSKLADHQQAAAAGPPQVGSAIPLPLRVDLTPATARPTPAPPPPARPPASPPSRACPPGDGKCALDALDPQQLSFSQFAARVPWRTVGSNHQLCQQLKGKLLHWIEKDPSPVEPPQECAPAPPKPTAEQCRRANPLLFSGLRGKPRTMVSAVVFGWELDVLEVHMASLENVVDYYAIMENSWSHGKHRHVKPLLWERNKNKPRFRRFAERTLHAAIGVEEGMAMMAKRQREPGAAFEWASEDIQERGGWPKIKAHLAAKGLRWEWTQPTEDSDGLDVGITFGDADEIPDAGALNLLKWCRITSKEAFGHSGVTFAVWFVMGRLDVGLAYPSDFPFKAPQAAGLMHAFGNPGFCNPHQGRPMRPWGGTRQAMLGGAHLSHYPYLPFIMMKVLSGTHNTGTLAPWMIEALSSGDVHRFQGMAANLTGGFRAWYNKRMATRAEVLTRDKRYKQVVESSVLSWLTCARARYPTFWGSWDTRLD